jgi:hypothetical protein
MAPQVIDVTGLSDMKVEHLRRYVEYLRQTPEEYAPSGPPPDETPEQWVARFMAWAESHPNLGGTVDDSRESIYGEEGE